MINRKFYYGLQSVLYISLFLLNVFILIYKNILNYLSFSWIISAVCSLVLLCVAVFYARMVLSVKWVAVILFAIFSLFLIKPVYMLYVILHGPSPESEIITGTDKAWFSALFTTAIIAIQIIYLISCLFFSLFFTFWHARESKKLKPNFAKPFLITLATCIGIILILCGLVWSQDQAHKRTLCSNQSGMAEGLYSKIYFLKPIAKQEVVKIIKENNFTVQSMLLGGTKNLDYQYNFYFYPFLTSSIVDQKSLKSIVSFSNEEEGNEHLGLIDAYESNDTVVWSMDFKDVPMETMVKFVYHLDQQRKLGALVGSSLDYPDFHNIQPATNKHPIMQSSCYKYMR